MRSRSRIYRAEILEWACYKCGTEKEAKKKNYCGCLEGSSFCWYVPSTTTTKKERADIAKLTKEEVEQYLWYHLKRRWLIKFLDKLGVLPIPPEVKKAKSGEVEEPEGGSHE